jgi:hypothetical protein
MPYKANVSNLNASVVSLRLSKDGNGLWLLSDAEKVLLNKFTTGRAPELIMSYLINNRPGSLVTLAELRRDLEGVAAVDDLSEVIRKIGFDKKLKSIFFRRCSAKEVELINPVEISESDWQKIKQKRVP